jgi:hypothetical protein
MSKKDITQMRKLSFLGFTRVSEAEVSVRDCKVDRDDVKLFSGDFSFPR